MLDCLNYSNIVLIPKRVGPEVVGDFCPIVLLNNMVKIVSRLLANHLPSILKDLVSEYQTIFVLGTCRT